MRSPEKQLAFFFDRNGNIRLPDMDRRKKYGSNYKKGYEVRLVAANENELEQIRDLLPRCGLKPAKAFKKGNQWVQPLYGRSAVEWFRKACKLGPLP